MEEIKTKKYKLTNGKLVNAGEGTAIRDENGVLYRNMEDYNKGITARMRCEGYTEQPTKKVEEKQEPPEPKPTKQPKKKLSDIGYRDEITFGNDLNQEQKKVATDTPKKSDTNKTYKRVLVDYVEENENGSQTIRIKKPPLLLNYNGKHKFVGAKTIAIEFSFFINANPDKENEITDNSILF